MSETPLILTLALDDEAHALFSRLRNEHFPPARNVVPAHLTLFHKLPHGAPEDHFRHLDQLAGNTAPVALAVEGLRFLGAGVSFAIDSPALVGLRDRLAGVWWDGLSPQDRQPFRPHVTIQNKADPAAAKALFTLLSERFEPFVAKGEGLLLWHYLGGPWRLVRSFPFVGADEAASGG